MSKGNDLTKAIQDAAKKQGDFVITPKCDSSATVTIPKVFIFQSDLDYDSAINLNNLFAKQIKDGVLVIPDSVKLVAVETLCETVEM